MMTHPVWGCEREHLNYNHDQLQEFLNKCQISPTQ
jgi:hypothetical protein